MSLRSFTVFQDVPSSDQQKPKNTNNTPTAILTSTANSVAPNHATLTTTEKENVHPVTGERAGPNNTKKRKTSVLATKVHVPVQDKKQKEPKDALPDAKKRKSSSSTSSVKGKTTSRKEGKSRKAKKAPSRRVSPMPKLDEEADTERERHVTQADIDSRCYELTVKPLADVSQAYEQSASFEIPSSCNENLKFCPVKALSVEPEIRDYYLPPQGSSLPAGSIHPPSSPSRFSTPERKQIYAAFTFTSPSPTSERFNKATRAGSVPRLELV